MAIRVLLLMFKHVRPRELPLGDRNYTWANNLEDPTFENLTEICCVLIGKRNILAVTPLQREIVDHIPLILDTGEHSCRIPIFINENAWILREDLNEVVFKVRDAGYSHSSIEIWQKKLRTLGKKLRGWDTNVTSWYRKLRKNIVGKLDAIDKH